MVYALAYAMHLTVNSFVRFKYFIDMSEVDSVLLAFSKGLLFVFLPSLIVQKVMFNFIPDIYMIIIMGFALLFGWFTLPRRRSYYIYNKIFWYVIIVAVFICILYLLYKRKKRIE